MTYGNDSDPRRYGPRADGFAAKGAVHARVADRKRADDFVDVFITHLESFSDAVRDAQYPLLAAFIRKYAAPDHPALIMGDMNTPGPTHTSAGDAVAYRRMVAALQGARPLAPVRDLWKELGAAPGGTDDPDAADGGVRIDYIFLSNPNAARLRLKPLSVRVNRFLDDKVTSLSDHAALEAELSWSP